MLWHAVQISLKKNSLGSLSNGLSGEWRDGPSRKFVLLPIANHPNVLIAEPVIIGTLAPEVSGVPLGLQRNVFKHDLTSFNSTVFCGGKGKALSNNNLLITQLPFFSLGFGILMYSVNEAPKIFLRISMQKKATSASF